MSVKGFVKEGKVYREAFLSFQERAIGDVVDTDENALEYFSKRFVTVENKVDELEQKINEATNKGSFLGHLLHLKNNLGDFDALGDFEGLHKKLEELENQLKTNIEGNRSRNLEIKRALLTELKVLATSKEWKTASHLVKELQSKWAKTGAVASEFKEEIEGTYEILIQGFYDNRAAFYNDLNQMMKEREASYEEFVENARILESIKDLEKIRSEIRRLKEEWKGLGKIKKASGDKYWAAFQEIIKKALEVAKKEAKSAPKVDRAQVIKNYRAFLSKLSDLSNDLNRPYNIEKIKKDWAKLGSLSKKDLDKFRSEYSKLITILSEARFVEELAQKRAKKDTKPEDLRKLKIKLIRDLLERDKRELNTFNENLGNFTTAKGLDKIIGNKLELQQRKVDIKKFILDQYRKQEV